MNNLQPGIAPKALIAMSGGVDSSVAAYLMLRAGYDCLGATMRLCENIDAGLGSGQTRCQHDPAEDARAIAQSLGIPFYVFDFTADFRQQVIARFIAAYEQGATPNPCIDCNRYLKFERLHGCARELSCDFVATGHYARIERAGGRYLLKRAVDRDKDQSYVLYALTQEQLAYSQFPLGALHKAEARQIAEQQGFINAGKRESQDICFAPDGDYARVIESLSGKTYPPGDFVDSEGRVLGQHRGIIRYTVGQRKGLGLALTQPMYVCEKRMADNSVVLGGKRDLLACSLEAADFNWIACDAPAQPLRCQASLRYRQRPAAATVFATGPHTARIEFDAPQSAVAKGQAAVLYDGDIVIGGGVIV